MNYKVIEKNEYGVLVESENSMSDCSECKYAKDRDVSCLKKCDSNIYRYYLPDSEVEKLEYESDLKAKNEEIEDCQHPYRFLERNENGLFCKKCKMQISSDPNIY